MSPDCILKFACYLCLRDETVSPGLPTRARLLIGSHSSREECLFHLSAADFPRRVYRFPSAGFHLAVLRTHLGPGANLTLLRAHVLRLHISLMIWSIRTSRTPTTSSGFSTYNVCSGINFLSPIKFDLAWRNCVLADTRTLSSLVSDFVELKRSNLLWFAGYP